LAIFEEKHGRSPRSYNDQDANEIVRQARTLMVDLYNKEATESQLRAFKMLSYTARGNLSPIASYLGGIVAQEALKALTGKFTPLDQWMFLDASSCLPYNDQLPTESDTQPLGTRYDGQIAVFGLEYQKKLAATNAFIVGAGALGCEYIKLLCMMGVGVGTGSIHITDMDSIEVRNLFTR
jgi:ubiquitin-activating enzyme E1